jgi:hypothetical protein
MIISQRNSIRYRVLPGRRRDELLTGSGDPTSTRLDDGWWKVVVASALS